MSSNPLGNIGKRRLDEIWDRYIARISDPNRQRTKEYILDPLVDYFAEAAAFFAEYYLTYYCGRPENEGHIMQVPDAILEEVQKNSVRILHSIGIHSDELEEVITDAIGRAYWGRMQEIILSSSDTGGVA